MNKKIFVENIRCGGCANTITKNLSNDFKEVLVNIEEGSISFLVEKEEDEKEIKERLLSLGYPVKGENLTKFQDLKAKGTSFVSCAVGKIDK